VFPPLAKKGWQAPDDKWTANLLRLNAENMRVLLEAHGTSSVAAAATGTSASRLSTTRLQTLQAAAGINDDGDAWGLSKFYQEMQREGLSVDAIHAGLRRCCVPAVGSRHRARVHVTRAMAVTGKTCNFSASNDSTFEGCTLGVTPFAVPHLRATEAHEEELDSNAFEDATLRTQADNKKFMAGRKFTPPNKISDVIKSLNNYVLWIEVLFGSWCPHLLMVTKLRDVLYDLEEDLDRALDKYLCLTILWKVHEDARRFFHQCDTWSQGEVMPVSRLHTLVKSLDEDFLVIRSLTCPFDRFFTKVEDTPKTKNGRKEKEAGGGAAKVNGVAKVKKEPKPTRNPNILSVCEKAVAKLRAAHPDIDIHALAEKSGMPASKFIIGNGGGCTNFQLLGQCNNADCKYKHSVPTVTDNRLKDVNSALLEAIKAMAPAAGA
jgi:hypothetical protein